MGGNRRVVGMTLDVPTLLVAAHAVGLRVTVLDHRVTIKGPRAAAGLVELILCRVAVHGGRGWRDRARSVTTAA